jgi:hypothetical protein
MTVKKITLKTIEEETDLLPELIAEIVAEKTIHEAFKTELAKWEKLDDGAKIELDRKIKAEQTSVEEYLVLRANTTFQYNTTFRKDIKSKGNKGRDTLYMFMYHWVGWYEDKVVASYTKPMENYYRDMKNFNENK